MGLKKDITKEQKRRIKKLLKKGTKSLRNIAIQVGVSVASVFRISTRVKSKISISDARPTRKNKCRATTTKEDKKIKRICIANCAKTLHEIAEIVRESGIQVSDRTIRRRIHELGIKTSQPIQ